MAGVLNFMDEQKDIGVITKEFMGKARLLSPDDYLDAKRDFVDKMSADGHLPSLVSGLIGQIEYRGRQEAMKHVGGLFHLGFKDMLIGCCTGVIILIIPLFLKWLFK